MLHQLNQVLPTRDTPRGLVVNVPDRDFQGSALRPPGRNALSRVAIVMVAHPGIRATVEGYTDDAGL